MIPRFEDVRRWAKIRGVDTNEEQVNYNRFMQEGLEIHEALIEDDDDKFRDAIGDTIVTLINLAKGRGFLAEDCLDEAFGVIEFRKGLTQEGKGFVRYAKLSEADKLICDHQQGNAGKEHYPYGMVMSKEPFHAK